MKYKIFYTKNNEKFAEEMIEANNLVDAYTIGMEHADSMSSQIDISGILLVDSG